MGQPNRILALARPRQNVKVGPVPDSLVIMKTAFILGLLAALSTIQAHAQGTVIFGNNSSSRLTQWDGSFVPGWAGVRVELMYAPDGTDLFLFRSIAVRLGNDASVGTPAPGLFSGGGRTAPTTTPGGFGLFQVRAWRPIDGPSFDVVFASGNVQASLGQNHSPWHPHAPASTFVLCRP